MLYVADFLKDLPNINVKIYEQLKCNTLSLNLNGSTDVDNNMPDPLSTRKLIILRSNYDNMVFLWIDKYIDREFNDGFLNEFVEDLYLFWDNIKKLYPIFIADTFQVKFYER